MTDREVMQQALEALEGLFGLPNQWESGGVAVWRLGGSDAPRQAITALRTALAMHQVSEFAQAQEQQAEPSQWRDMVVVNLVREGVNKHKARELADHFAAQQQAEPVETYIHEYRNQPHPNDFGIPKGHWWQAKQYADAVYTTPPAPQQQAEPPPEWESIKNILDEYGLDAIAFVKAWKAVQQQAEPVAWMCCVPGQDAILLFDEPSDERYPPKYKDPLYTHLPQRQWVGLTDEDFCDQDGEWADGASWAEAKLKERNND